MVCRAGADTNGRAEGGEGGAEGGEGGQRRPQTVWTADEKMIFMVEWQVGFHGLWDLQLLLCLSLNSISAGCVFTRSNGEGISLAVDMLYMPAEQNVNLCMLLCR